MRARRRQFTDRVDRDGEAVVLVGDQVVRLSPLSTLLVDSCGDWAEVEDLAAGLVGVFGRPPGQDATAATDAVVHELAGRGVLELG